MKFKIPGSLTTKHEALHEELVRATKVKGRIGEAAREVATLLHPHFVAEEEYALPPRGLLTFIIVMAVGADAWLTRQLLWLAGWPIHRVAAWWAGFLVLARIAGERLELARPVRVSRASRAVMLAAVAGVLAGLVPPARSAPAKPWLLDTRLAMGAPRWPPMPYDARHTRAPPRERRMPRARSMVTGTARIMEDAS